DQRLRNMEESNELLQLRVLELQEEKVQLEQAQQQLKANSEAERSKLLEKLEMLKKQHTEDLAVLTDQLDSQQSLYATEESRLNEQLQHIKTQYETELAQLLDKLRQSEEGSELLQLREL